MARAITTRALAGGHDIQIAQETAAELAAGAVVVKAFTTAVRVVEEPPAG